MRKQIQRDEIASLLFGLTDQGVEFRNKWRSLAGLAVWFILSGFTMVLNIFGITERLHLAIVIVLGFLKYIPLLYVVYNLARNMSAQYLDDIFELHDDVLASDFLEEVTFGYGHEHITITEGSIPESDEISPIILIGGPGTIQVNLDSVALLEKVNGEPEVISPRSAPWKLGRFERLREIGKFDEVGKREYAIISLREQFVSGLTVKARTKDGIPIEAQGIKIIFSILHKQPAEDDEDQNKENLFDEQAVRALVYNQTIITPEPASPSPIAFPWDTTAIPLVLSELEKLITSRTLSEILASISQKEVDTASKNDETIAQMRGEMTGQQTLTGAKQESQAPNFVSRSTITAQFFKPEFKEKAAKLGISIEWIDIGTWQLPSSLILDKHKDAWNLLRDNAKKRKGVEQSKKQHEMDELQKMINSVIISNFERTISSSKVTDKEVDEFDTLIKADPALIRNPNFARQYLQHAANKKGAHTITSDILKAFRKELLAAKVLIEKENRSSFEKQNELAVIDKALRDISHNISHYVKNAK